MNRWEQTEAFVKVVANQSFSKAAEAMNVSKAHVSRQVTQLENRLGAQLLVRTTRKLSLTEVGRAYYQRCADVLNNISDAEKAVVDLQEKPRGTLRISAAGAFGENYIAPACANFMKANPDLRIEIDFSNRVIDLIAEGFDLAIRAGTLKDSSLIARRIAARKLIIVASPEYLQKKGTPNSISSLDNHNCLMGSQSTWRFNDKGRHFDLKVSGNWRSNNGHALVCAARQGLGLAQLPDFYVNAAVSSGELQSVLDSSQPTDAGFWAVYPYNRHLSAKVRMFLNFLTDRMNSKSYSILPLQI